METPPKVSVILPAYYSHETVRLSLDSLRRQSYRDFETIVVNSSPETRTAAILEGEYREVRFFQAAERMYPHRARNYGVERARGELLVFSDPDVVMRADWLELLVEAWEGGAEVGVGAMEVLSATWWERGVHLAKFYELLPGGSGKTRWIAPTANAFYSRKAWERIGKFPDHGFVGDAVQSWKAAAAGMAPRFVSAAVVEHVLGGDWGQLRRERWRRGQEFLRERAMFFGWGRDRILVYGIGAIGLGALVVWRTGVAAGWSGSYWATLPVQVWAQGWWAMGETWGAWRASR
jgi:glycosyltransferase involved in cell wall biosynthesis